MRFLKKIVLGLSLISTIGLAENHALIIGCCSEYLHLKGINKLNGTQNDADHIFNLLVKRHKVVKPKNSILLKNQNATYRNIVNSLKNIERNSNLKAGDILYIFYSGHGTSLSDSGYFGKKFKSDRVVREWISNSTGLIPYDFNPKSMSQTMIITKRDFKPIFKRLDSRGVRTVWIVDACFSGNAYRSADISSPQKFLPLDEKPRDTRDSADDPKYKYLLFYGASLATLPTTEHPYEGEIRGDFSIEIERCLSKSYGGSEIRHGDLKKCLKANFANTQIQRNYYPEGRLDNQVVIKNLIPTPTKEKSYREKLFELQSNQPLNIDISSLHSKSRVIKTFCKGERLAVKLSGKRGKYIIALSLDKNGKVIMLQPDKKNRMRGNELFQTDVVEPFGTDKLKVFATDDKEIYKTALQFWDKKSGVLSSTDMEKLYKALKSSGNFQTAILTVETISKDVKECIKGD